MTHAGWGRWRFSRVTAGCLGLGVAFPLAACLWLTDPTWIGGVYDGDDRDDLLIAASWLDGAPVDAHAPTAPGRVERDRISISRLPDPRRPVLHAPSSRAPPLG